MRLNKWRVYSKYAELDGERLYPNVEKERKGGGVFLLYYGYSRLTIMRFFFVLA